MATRRVSEDEIRQLFNEGRYYERMRAGEFHARIIRQNPHKRGDRRVRNTLSQTVEYWDKFGNLVARVHQFRKEDGSLGGSGRPDPKLLIHDGMTYVLKMGEDWDLANDWDE